MAMMDPKSIGAHIRMRRPHLSDLEQKVLDNIIAKEDFSENTSIKEIAQENNVSEAMIVKIAKRLGFNGFRELRANLVLYNQLEVSQMFNEISSDDKIEVLVDKVFGNSIQALKETQAILSIEALKKAVDILYNADEILIYGVGGSNDIGLDLAHKFLRIGIKAHVHSDAHMMLMSASLCTKRSAVIAISHSGRSKDVIETVSLARDCGAKTIVLTNYDTSPIASYADVILSSTSQGSPLLGENAASRIAQLNILDVIYVAIVQKNLKVSEENLIKTRASIESMRQDK